jgi:hypothetical protein
METQVPSACVGNARKLAKGLGLAAGRSFDPPLPGKSAYPDICLVSRWSVRSKFSVANHSGPASRYSRLSGMPYAWAISLLRDTFRMIRFPFEMSIRSTPVSEASGLTDATSNAGCAIALPARTSRVTTIRMPVLRAERGNVNRYFGQIIWAKSRPGPFSSQEPGLCSGISVRAARGTFPS